MYMCITSTCTNMSSTCPGRFHSQMSSSPRGKRSRFMEMPKISAVPRQATCPKPLIQYYSLIYLIISTQISISCMISTPYINTFCVYPNACSLFPPRLSSGIYALQRALSPPGLEPLRLGAPDELPHGPEGHRGLAVCAPDLQQPVLPAHGDHAAAPGPGAARPPKSRR